MGTEFHVGVIPGDGTGPEVVAEGIKVLNAAASRYGFGLKYTTYDLGGERYKRTGETLPDSVIRELKQHKAIFLGAIGHPEVAPGILEKGILLRARFELDQYINLRPVKLYEGVDTPLKNKGPEEIDFVVVRENTEGLYAGAGGVLKRGTADEVAIQESINTRKGVERCIRFAFDITRKRNKGKKLTLCGKTNVLTFAFDLWERTSTKSRRTIRHRDGLRPRGRHLHVDGQEPRMVRSLSRTTCSGHQYRPGAMIQGGMGVAAGGNINPEGSPSSSPSAAPRPNTRAGTSSIPWPPSWPRHDAGFSRSGGGAQCIETSVQKPPERSHLQGRRKMGMGTKKRAT